MPATGPWEAAPPRLEGASDVALARPLQGGSIRASPGLAKAPARTHDHRASGGLAEALSPSWRRLAAAPRKTHVREETALHLHPDDARRIRAEFEALTNLSQAELAAWLETPQSRSVGMVRRGETESVGRQSARRILEIRAKAEDDLTDADYAHMKKVIGFRRRHLAQRPWGDVTLTRWRYSLMNWGHDPLKGRLGG